LSTPLLTDASAGEPDRREAEALLAAVLTLMTDHALACCEGHQAAVRQRIAACFLALARAPGLSAASRSVASRLHQRWLPLAAIDASSDVSLSSLSSLSARPTRGEPFHDDNKVLWHTTPELIQ
jgi:hypothetical protein